ncbi:MAG: SH3 domain-containing protein [Desulfosarcinaceae bacterium]|jgi:hypothetical protein
MKKTLMTSLKIGIVILLVLTLALPAWAGRGHRHRPRHHPPRYHQHHRGHVQLHAVGAGLLGLGLVTGAAIAATAFSPPVVVHQPAPCPPPAPQRWEKRSRRHPKHRRYHELGAAQVTVQLLNVRQNPGRHAPIVTQVTRGSYLSVRATSDGWLFVSLGGNRTGWVMTRFTSWGRPHSNG